MSLPAIAILQLTAVTLVAAVIMIVGHNTPAQVALQLK